MNPSLWRTLRRLLREVVMPFALLLAALLFLWEEVLWVRLGRAMTLLGRLPAAARIEAGLRGLGPESALIAFAIPLALTYPPKLVALWLIASGHAWSGITLLAALEVLAAAILAWVYASCRAALQTMVWFARAEAIVIRWSHWAHRRLGLRELLREAMDAEGAEED